MDTFFSDTCPFYIALPNHHPTPSSDIVHPFYTTVHTINNCNRAPPTPTGIPEIWNMRLVISNIMFISVIILDSTFNNAQIHTSTSPKGCCIRESSRSGACQRKTEAPPPLEEALLSLKLINLYFLNLTLLLLILFSTFATSLTVARYKLEAAAHCP